MITAKVAKRPFLEIPEKVYDALNLKQKKEVKIEIFPIEGKSEICLSKEEKLAILEKYRGAWADDERIAEAFDYLERKWAEWKPIEF